MKRKVDRFKRVLALFLLIILVMTQSNFGMLSLNAGMVQTKTEDSDFTFSLPENKVISGTAAWDEKSYDINTKEYPGCDSDSANNIVRSFDTVTYTVDYSGKSESSNIFVQVTLPVSAQKAEFDISAMQADNITVESYNKAEEKQTILLSIPFKKKGSLDIPVKVKGMDNQSTVSITAKASLTKEALETVEEIKGKDIIVTAAPSYNLKVTPGSEGEFGVILEAINTVEEKGRKGLAISDSGKNITFDLNVKDMTVTDVIPQIVDYKTNSSSESGTAGILAQTDIMSDIPLNADSTGSYNKTRNSGKITIKRDASNESLYHVTITGIEWPESESEYVTHTAKDTSKENAKTYSDNEVILGTYFIKTSLSSQAQATQSLQDETKSHLILLNAANLKIVGMDSITETNVVTSDDSGQSVYTLNDKQSDETQTTEASAAAAADSTLSIETTATSEQVITPPVERATPTDRSIVNNNQEITYSMAYTNTTSLAQKIKFTNKIPDNTTYVTDSAIAGTTMDNNTLTHIADVGAGATYTIEFKVTVNSDTAADTIIANTAHLDVWYINETESVDIDNTLPDYSTDTSTVNHKVQTETQTDTSAFKITSSAVNNKVSLGQNITYTMTYNNTTTDKQVLEISDTIQNQVFVSATASDKGITVLMPESAEDELKWVISDIEPGETVNVTLTTKHDSSSSSNLMKNAVTANIYSLPEDSNDGIMVADASDWYPGPPDENKNWSISDTITIIGSYRFYNLETHPNNYTEITHSYKYPYGPDGDGNVLGMTSQGESPYYTKINGHTEVTKDDNVENVSPGGIISYRYTIYLAGDIVNYQQGDEESEWMTVDGGATKNVFASKDQNGNPTSEYAPRYNTYGNTYIIQGVIPEHTTFYSFNGDDSTAVEVQRYYDGTESKAFLDETVALMGATDTESIEKLESLKLKVNNSKMIVATGYKYSGTDNAEIGYMPNFYYGSKSVDWTSADSEIKEGAEAGTPFVITGTVDQEAIVTFTYSVKVDSKEKLAKDLGLDDPDKIENLEIYNQLLFDPIVIESSDSTNLGYAEQNDDDSAVWQMIPYLYPGEAVYTDEEGHPKNSDGSSVFNDLSEIKNASDLKKLPKDTEVEAIKSTVYHRAYAPKISSIRTKKYIDYDDGVNTVSLICVNPVSSEDKIPVSFYKVKATDHSQPIEGARFRLYKCSSSTHTHDANDTKPTKEEDEAKSGWLVTEDILSLPYADRCWRLYGITIDSKSYSEVSSGADGKVDLGELSSGTYMLVEVSTPAQYILPKGQWMLTIDATEGSSAPITITARSAFNSVKNEFGIFGGEPPAFIEETNTDGTVTYKLPNAGFDLPMTGKRGVIYLSVTGIALIAIGSVLLLRLKQKRINKI